MSIVDLLLPSVLFISIILTISGIALLIWSKRKAWFFVLVAAAFLPVLIALPAATFFFYSSEARLKKDPDISREAIEFFYRQNRNSFTLQVSLGAV